MKLGKKSTYFLFPALAVIWGLLGYRIYTTFFPSEPIASSVEPPMQYAKKSAEEERYKPSLNYPDPFLKKPRVARKVVKPKVEEIENKVEKPKIKPNVEYLGFISSQDNDQKQVVISYKGKVLILSIGDNIETFRVASISSDTVVLVEGNVIWKYGLKP